MCTTAAIGRGAHVVKVLSTSGPAEVGPREKHAAKLSTAWIISEASVEAKMSVRHALLLGEWPHLMYYPYCIRGYVIEVNRATPFHFL